MHDNDNRPLLSTEPGDLANAAELNVTLALSNRIFAILLCLLTLLGALLGTRTAGAASLDHFAWSTVSSPQETGAPFTAVLTACDENGNVVSNYNGNVTISAEKPCASPLVISEVDNGNTNQVEFTNPSTNFVDVSGWTVAFYDYTKWPQPATVFTIPDGTICPPQSNFVIEANGYPPGTFPMFFIGFPLQWNLSSDPVAVSLLDQTNGLVDFFCASTAGPYLISNPAPILPGGWIGGPVPLNSNPAYTYQRQGDFNQRQALDWIATSRSIGILNSTLSLPFAPNYTPIGISPGSVYITNGIWSGFIAVDATGSNVVLHADNEAGNPGISNPFDLVSSPTVALSLPPQTSDLTPGVQQAAIGIPSVLGINLLFSLVSSDPAKIAVPSSVVMSAGTTSAGFSLTNFNDSITDGVQLVTITVSNYLFAPGVGIITNFSAPVQLKLSVPNIVEQQPGAIVGQAQLSTAAPLESNFQAELFSSDSSLLVTPYFVSIPAGETNIAFNLSAPIGPEIFGSREVTLTAFAGPGATARGSTMVTGLPTNLTLNLPQALTEGAGVISNATVSIAGILPTNLTVSMTSSDSSAVQVPVNVVLLAGQTSVMLPITVLSNSAASPDLSVVVSASAPGFANASASVKILDDHLGQFAFASIPLTQTANQPFFVSIMAETQSGEMLRTFTGTASLFPIGLPAGSLLPAQTGSFTNGLWSETITVTKAATNQIIAAQSGSASGQSNPFNVGPVFISTLNISNLSATVSGLIYDPRSDRIYASIPASSVVESNTIMRLNPHTASVEAYIPMDTNPGFMALSASNEYIYTGVQSGYSVERLNLGSQLPDLEFSLSGLYVYNMIGLPNSPASVAIAGLDIYSLLEDSIYDGNIARTNLADLDLTPGLNDNGVLSGGNLYLPDGGVINPTTQYPVGQFPVTGLVGTGPVVPDPNSGSVFFLTQQDGQTVIYAYSIATYALQASQTIPGVDSVAENLVRWGTNGLAFSTTGGQIFLAHFSLSPSPSSASLSVYQSAPPLASVGNNILYTINVTNAGNVSASDVVVSDQLPAGATFVSAQSSQGFVQDNSGILSGNLGKILPAGTATLTVTVQAQAPGVLRNTVSIITSTVNSSAAQMASAWLTSVSESGSSNQIAQLLISANDLVFNPVDGKLYASVSGTAGIFGNSIVAIDPLSLQPSNPIAVGSQPGALALSQDGRYLYVYMQSSASIELLDLQTDTVTFQNQLAYTLALTEMFVLPGSSDSLVFSQYYTGGTPSGRGAQIITDGVTSILSAGGGLIQPSLASNVFYCYANDGVPSSVSRVVINGTNATSTSAGGLTLDVEREIRSAGDLLFFSSGELIDPEVMIKLATFPGLGAPPYLSQPLNQICPDLPSGRVYYLIANGSTATIEAFSLNTYQLTGTFQVTGVIGTPEQLVRWGTNGFAFATTGGQVFSFQSSIVPANQQADLAVTQSTPISTTLLTNFNINITVTNQGPGTATGVTAYDNLPTGMRFASASATQGTITSAGSTLTASLGTLNSGDTAQLSILLRPDSVGTTANYVRVSANEPDPVMTNNSSVQTIAIATNISWNTIMYIGDLVYDPTRGKVFATVQSQGPNTNSIVQIDPGTGNIEQTLPTSFWPDKITISSDGQFLYVGDDTDDAVARINIQAWTNDLSFGLGNYEGIGYIVGDFAPLPDQPHSIAVSMHTWYGSYSPMVAIFDDGISRPDIIGAQGGAGTYFIQCSPDASSLYTTYGTFASYSIDASGIGNTLTNLSGYSSDFRIEDNLLITDSGQALNLQNDEAQGTFPASGLVAPDLEDGLVFFLVQSGPPSSPSWTLTACSSNMVNTRWQFAVPGFTGDAHSLIRCGPGIFAFATSTPAGYPNGYPVDQFNQLCFLHTSVLPPSGDLVLGVTTNWGVAGGHLENTFTILNDGPYFNATGVSFTNILPNGSTFVSASSTQGTCYQTNGIVTCAVGSMTGNSTVTIYVVSSMTNAGVVSQQASVSMNEPDIDPSNNFVSFTEAILSAPSITVSNLTVYRQSGVTANFEIVLAAPFPQAFSLFCYTTDGSAHSSGDYASVFENLIIPPGVTNESVPVSIKNDGLVESNVVFYLNIIDTLSSTPIAPASCTLINDTFYSLSVTNVSLTSSPSNITNAIFSVSLSGINNTPVSVDYFTKDGTTVSGIDYLAKAGTLVFPIGVTNGSVSIPVNPAAAYSPTKTFYLILANPVNAVLGVSQAAASIYNNNLAIGRSQIFFDGRFQLTINGGVPGQSYVLLASTNLVDWTPISGFVDTNPPVTIFDPDAADYSQRFYKIGPMNLAPAMKLGFNVTQPFDGNGFAASLFALPGFNYEIEVSTNLINWIPLTSFVSTNSPFYFSDPSVTNYSQRFYRAVKH